MKGFIERVRRRRDQRLVRSINLIDRSSRRVGRLVTWLIPLLVAVSAWNTIARTLDREFGTALSSNTWLETGWYLFALIFLLGAAPLLAEDRHVRVDLFYERLTERGKARVDLLGSTFLLLPFALFVIWSVWPTVVESWTIREASPDPGGLPRWPIRAVVPIAFAFLAAQGLAVALSRLRLLLGRERGEA